MRINDGNKQSKQNAFGDKPRQNVFPILTMLRAFNDASSVQCSKHPWERPTRVRFLDEERFFLERGSDYIFKAGNRILCFFNPSYPSLEIFSIEFTHSEKGLRDWAFGGSRFGGRKFVISTFRISIFVKSIFGTSTFGETNLGF